MPRPKQKARKPKWRVWGQFKYDVNGNGMSPFFIGLPAGEFMPVDPAAWFNAAVAANMRFCRWKEGESQGHPVFVDHENLSDAAHFLTGLLYGTDGGLDALAAFMDARKIRLVAVAE